MKYYQIQATIHKTYPDGSKAAIQVPTFYINTHIHGDVTHSLICSIVNPTADKTIDVYYHVVKVTFSEEGVVG